VFPEISIGLQSFYLPTVNVTSLSFTLDPYFYIYLQYFLLDFKVFTYLQLTLYIQLSRFGAFFAQIYLPTVYIGKKRTYFLLVK
jgi:hypothetical protein